MTKYQQNIIMLVLAGYSITLVITHLGFLASEELTTGNNALHFLYILKIVRILQNCLIQFTIGPTVNTLGAFLMKVVPSSQSLEYCNHYTVSFYMSLNKIIHQDIFVMRLHFKLCLE